MRVRRLIGGWAVFVIMLSGCSTFAPGSMSSLTMSRDEKKVLTLAKADPFPSPADVGLAQPTDIP